MEPLQKIRLPAAGSSRSREAFSHPDIVFPLSVEIFPIAASFRLLQRNDHVPGALRRHEVVFAIGGRKKRRPPSHFQTAGRGAPGYPSGEPFHRPKGLPWSKPERPSGAPNEDRLPKKRGR